MTARDILLITVDSLRADRMGWSGYERSTTPTLNQVANEAITFENATTQGPTTFTSFPSIHTGRHAYETPNFPTLKGQTIAEQLRSAGYHTLSITSNAWISPTYDYDQGFDAVHNLGRGPRSADSRWDRVRHRIADGLGDGAIYKLVKGAYDRVRNLNPTDRTEEDVLHDVVVDHVHSTDRTFTWVHYMTAHAPYVPDPDHGPYFTTPANLPTEDEQRELIEAAREDPAAISESDRELFRTLYDESVRHVDRRIGDLLEQVGSETVVVITADHGEELWDHGSYEHPPRLYQELLNVPLLITHPEIDAAAIADPVSLCDIPATLAGVADADFPIGTSLLDRYREQDYPECVRSAVAHASRFEPKQIHADQLQVAIRSGPWKLIYGFDEESRQLYNLNTDPQEQNDQSDVSEPDETLLSHAEAFRDRFIFDQADESMSEELEDQLRELGYLKWDPTMSTPTVSVILPAYNEAKWIADCIESVIGQTYDDLEIVVVDDGSTDETPAIVKGYDDPRVKYYRQENAGSAAARNTALDNATGEYMAIIDADDIWFEDKLERQLSVMKSTDTEFTYTNMELVDGEGNTLGQKHDSPPPEQTDRNEFIRKLFMRNFISHPTVVFHRKTIDDRAFDEDFAIINDHDLYLRIASEYDVKYIDDILVRKRYHGGNISGSQNYEQLYDERVRFVEKIVDQYPVLEPLRDRKLAQVNLTYGINLITNGHQHKGQQALVRSLKHNPANWRVYPALLLSVVPSVLKRLSKQR